MLAILKIIGVIAGIGFVLVVLFAWALIRASKKSAKSDVSLESRIKQAVSTARRIRFKAEADIKRLKMWANDAIRLTYGQLVDNYPVDTLVENYEQIHEKYASRIDPQQAEQTRKIVEGYLGQIQIKQVELETAIKTEEKYRQLLEQLKSAKLKDKKYSALGKHARRLEQLEQNTDNTKQLIEQNLSFDMIKNDVEQQLAYLEALQQLQEKYDTHTFTQNARVYRQEMESIVKNIG